MEHKTIKPIILILSIIIIAVAIAFFFLKSPVLKPVPSTSPVSVQVVAPEFLIGTFPPVEESIEISIQKSQNAKTAQLSWNDSQFQVFHIVVFDSELFDKGESSAIWNISSAKRFPTDINDNFKKEDVAGFLPSGYAIGDTIQGFKALEVPGFELSQRKNYYLQMIGFANDTNLTINKAFTFTTSCLPPDCN